MTQQASIPLRQLLSKDLKSNVCGPNLTWSRAYASSDKEQSMSDRVRKGALTIFLFDGTFFKCKAKFPAQDISSIFFDSWFTRELLQLPFSQAARRVMFCPHIVSCICDRSSKRYIKPWPQGHWYHLQGWSNNLVFGGLDHLLPRLLPRPSGRRFWTLWQRDDVPTAKVSGQTSCLGKSIPEVPVTKVSELEQKSSNSWQQGW